MKLKVFVCVVLVAVLAVGLTVDQSAARTRSGIALRMHDRLISVGAPQFSANSARGFVTAKLAVTVDNIGHKSLAVSQSDFAVAAQGDIFNAQAWDGGRRPVEIRSRHSRVFRFTFALPAAAAKQAVLLYRPAHSGTFGSVPLNRSPRLRARAASASGAQPSVSSSYATGGVGDPWGTAIDSAGNVWFAEPGCDFAPTCGPGSGPGQIGEIKASSQTVVLYTLPNISGNQPIFLAFDNSGNLWFTTPNNSMIGEFNPSTGQFVGQWPVTAGSGPWDLTFAGGQIWYTEHLVSAVGSFNPATHAYRDFQTPSANSNPYGIAAAGGRIWFTENNSSVDRIAVLDTTRNDAISEYPIVLPVGGTPHLVTIGAGGAPWWTEGWSGTIATLDPAEATPGRCGTSSGTCHGVTRFQPPAPTACSNSGTHTSGIAFQASSGQVWFDNSLTAQVGSFDPASNAFAVKELSNCGAHPHDGLALDATGNLWFSEEFANTIEEFVAPPPPAAVPTVVTGSSTAVGPTSATVSGSVNPHGQATTCHFDYGTSTRYGSQAPAPLDPSAGSGTTAEPVSANLTALSPDTTYHYRLVASNSSGTQYGADQTFLTATPSEPTGTGSSSTSAPTPSSTSAPTASPVAITGTTSLGQTQSPTASSHVGTPAPSQAQLKKQLLKQLAPTGKASRIVALLRHRGYALRFQALGAGRVEIAWCYLQRPRSGNAKAVIVAIGKATFSRAGRVALKIMLTPRGRRILKASRRLRLTALGSYAPAGRPAVAAGRAFTLRR